MISVLARENKKTPKFIGSFAYMGEGRRDVSKGKGHGLFAGLLRAAWTWAFVGELG